MLHITSQPTKFTYSLPVNLIFARGSVSHAGTETAKLGTKALVVTGRSSTKKSGLLDRVTALLAEAAVETVVFDQVDPNPLTTTAYRGAQLANEAGCDVVVGLGGGSILDAAKAIAFSARNPGDLSDYIFNRKSSPLALPIVLIPTTCGTGSEANGFAVLTNPETNDKKSLRCAAIIAKASIIDPELMATMGNELLATVGFDALCHNMEALLSSAGQHMTAMMAREGTRLVAECLPRVYANRDDLDAWDGLCWGSTLGGMVINTAGVAAPHGMEHPASGLRNITHGKGLAALTPVVFEETIPVAPAAFAEISRLIGGHDETDCVASLRKLLGAIGLNVGLGELGVGDGDIEWMAENCMKVSAAGIANHPKAFAKNDLVRIYRNAL